MNKVRVFLLALVAQSLLVSCSGLPTSSPQSTELASTTSVAPSTLSDTFSDTPSSSLASTEMCHIEDLYEADGTFQTNLVGFPRPEVVQSPKVLVLPFSFSDGEPPTKQLGGSLGALKGASHFFEEISWGKAILTFEVAPKELWLKIPKTAAEMGFSKESPGSASPFRILDYMDPALSVNDYDIVYLIGSPDLTQHATAMMELDPRDTPREGPAGTVSRAVMITFNHNDATLAAHELGHAWLNLWDLYNMQEGITDFVGLNRFDLMFSAVPTEYNASDMTIWNKYLAGWVDPDQIRCITDAGISTHFISTNSLTSDLAKAIVVKISETKILVIDTWRKSEFNRCCNETVAYVVDVSRMMGAGPFRLQGALKNPGDQLVLDGSVLSTNSKWTFRPNESLTISNVTVKLLDSDDSGALVEVITG